MSLFGRKAEINCEGLTLDSEALDIEFDVPFDNDVEPNKSSIKIYNLTDDTINRFKRNKKLILNAGYKGDIGVILSGYISRTKTARQGVDKVTTINVLDSEPLDTQKTLNKTYKKNIKASQIINDLLSILKLDATVNLARNRTYSKGYTVDGEIVEALANIAKDCGVTFFMSKGKAYISGIHSGEASQFTLSEETGLIGTPAIFEEDGHSGFSVTCLLQHRIATANAVTLQSEIADGKFYVYKGKHRWSGSEFVTELDIIY
ncbi:phage protein [Virgibacillus sediminis]|uniref:Phage protein n=1 Tax=Virgibacillus sediminis TaxID=202260 RepID=A0ABV7A6L7_9BACI